jgi:hypothetical protein
VGVKIGGVGMSIFAKTRAAIAAPWIRTTRPRLVGLAVFGW